MTNISIDELDQSGDLRQIADDAGAYDPDNTRRDLLRKAGIGGAAVFGGSMMAGFISPLDAFAATSVKGEYSTSVTTSSKATKIVRTKGPSINDVKIGNYALTLEYLEAAFYAAADGMKYADPDIAAAAKVLATHEAAHVAFLKKTLGKFAVKAPSINGDSVAKLLVDQNTFIKTASAIEPVGTSAYAGAGPYVTNLAIVKAALMIHSVEANHASYTASIVKFKGIDPSVNPVPTAFNQPASFKKVLGEVGKLDLTTGTLQPS